MTTNTRRSAKTGAVAEHVAWSGAARVALLAAAAGVGALAGVSAPAYGQEYDIEKYVPVQFATAPSSFEVKWKPRLRAVARVGKFCRDADGFQLFPNFNDVAANTSMDDSADAAAGRNDNCKANAQVYAYWTETSFTDHMLYTRVIGSASPAADKCVGRKDRPARARSRAKSILKMKGVNGGTSGVKGFAAQWVNKQNHVTETKQREKELRDPVVARLYDSLGTQLGEWELISVDSKVYGNGETRMFIGEHPGRGLFIQNNAADMDLRIEIGSAIVYPTDRGLIDVSVRGGFVTKRNLTGRFTGIVMPNLGDPGTSFLSLIDMSNIHFDMLAPTGTQTIVEYDISASSHDVSEDGLVAPMCSIITELDRGFDGMDLSVVPAGDGEIGFNCNAGNQSILENIAITSDVQPDFLVVPYYIEGAAPGTAPTDVYVRLYNGNPATGGTLIYGDGTTSQSFEVEDIEAYRVFPVDRLNTMRAMNEAVIDLSDAPLLVASTDLWVEVWMDYPAVSFVGLPSSPLSDSTIDNAMAYSFSTGQYSLLADPLSGRRACMPFELFGLPPKVCTSDFNGDGDYGTDADIEAFFACLAGNCCDTCFSMGADFNMDGDTGTDADIEAFFRVLSGGGC